MMGKKYLIFFAAALLGSADAFGQNLDPTVVVDRAYEGKLMEVHKPSIEMAVPDTVMKFDLDFDYSVFDTPFRGSYEFRPYVLSMKPDASLDKSRNLYLKAGAGYQLHPVLDLIWSPELRSGWSLDVYADHKSFIGKYHNLHDGSETASDAWSGHDLLSKAGVAGKYDWDRGSVDFGAGYYGVVSENFSWSRSYNAMDAFFSIASKPNPGRNYFYSLKADYRFAGDALKGIPEVSSIREHVFTADACIGRAFKAHRILFDAGADVAGYSNAPWRGAGQFYFEPRYEYRRDRFNVSLGIRVAKIFDSDEADGTYKAVDVEQVVYPDVRVEYILVPDILKVHAAVEGGNRINTYASLLDADHHLNPLSYVPASSPLDYTVVKADAHAGLEGNASSRLSYSFSVGYCSLANAPLEAVVASEDGTFVPFVSYAPYSKWYASLGLRWKSEDVMFDLSTTYDGIQGDAFVDGPYLLKPAALTGSASFEYNWNRRIYAGVDCMFSSARKGSIYTASGYADLGLSAEYALNRSLSFWLRAGNLLGMKVQRSPLYAEKGVYFTLGICLVL